MVEYLDGSVGAIIDTVRDLGLEKNTIVIFSSDNGYSAWGYFERRRRWEDDPIFRNKGPWNRGKFVTTNGGLIVPFIAWGPGRIPAGKTARAVNFYDFPATAAELARTKLPGPTDGVSFVPLLEGRERDQPLRPAMAWSHTTVPNRNAVTDDWDPLEKAKASPPGYKPDAVLLDERWFALAFQKQPAPHAPVIRLFDVAVDPGLEHDLSAKQETLRRRAEREVRALNAPPSARP